MDEIMDMRDELGQDFDETEETEEEELGASGMHVDEDGDETPPEEEVE